MGDRANIAIRSVGYGAVYLYSHWRGSDLPQILQAALKRNQRWDDAQYLSRIVFCTMISGRESEETGFGISASVGDGDNRILWVDVDTQGVGIDLDGEISASFTFSEFCALNTPSWESEREANAT